MTTSHAFLQEIAEQRRIAVRQMDAAAQRGDEAGLIDAVNRLADLNDIAERNVPRSATRLLPVS